MNHRTTHLALPLLLPAALALAAPANGAGPATPPTRGTAPTTAPAPATATPATAATNNAAPHPLQRALALDEDAIADLPPGTQRKLADWLWAWQFSDDAPVTGTEQDYIAATERARTIYRRLLETRPGDARLHWKLARAAYDLGELLPEDATDRRMALYEEMVSVTRTCIDEIDSENPGCLHFLATGIGRQATTRGVLASLFSADEVEEIWLKAYALESTVVALNGDPLLNGTRYGLGVFYRMVPDAWIVKLIAGVRGDIDKSIRFFREAVEVQPYRLELQKELAVALLCKWNRDDDETAAKAEGMEILRKIRAGAFDAKDRRAIDAIDKRHAADLIAHPDRACGYSRDGYEDLDEEAVEKVKAP